MPKRTPEQLLKQRQELYNYRNLLYPQSQERGQRLRRELKEVKQELKETKKDKDRLAQVVEKQQLIIEELREIAYGKKKVSREKQKVIAVFDIDTEGEGKEEKKKTKKERSTESYRRPKPKPEEITEEVRFDLEMNTQGGCQCPRCGNGVTGIREHESYREDLKELDILVRQSRRIVKRIHESGYCKNCKKRQHALPLDKAQLSQAVSFGQNLRTIVTYLNIFLGLSYSETITHLSNVYGIKVSQGEMTNILQSQADLLKPYYQQIYQELREEQGCHYDETGWKVQGESEGNYAWVKTGVTSNKILFWFGRSRGKGVAEKLRGYPGKMNQDQICISDDYPGYWNLYPPEKHQLCWAHPHRKLRDLAQSGTLNKTKLKHCRNVFTRFAKIYRDTEGVKQKSDQGTSPTKTQIEKLKQRLLKLMKPHKQDPEKLSAIKASITERIDRYFTCLRFPCIPLDNNKAERTIRRLVLKRKKSFGSKTEKGANMLTILYSAVFSLAWSYPQEEFFTRYREAIDGKIGD
jgi:transposase